MHNYKELNITTRLQLFKINLCHAWYYRCSWNKKESKNPQTERELRSQRLRKEDRAIEKQAEALAKGEIFDLQDLLKDPTFDFESYPPEVFKLARQIMKHILHKNRKPTFNDGMILNDNVAELTNRIETRLPQNHHKNEKKCPGCPKCKPATKYEYWIKFSSFKDEEMIYIPLKVSVYMRLQLEKAKRRGSKLSLLILVFVLI